jgi:hypothetical protein
MPKSHKEHAYIVKQTGPDQYEVLKLTYDDEGITEKNTYTVTKETCSCKSFQLHGHCKHHDMIFMVDFTEKPATISVKDAQAYAREWVKELEQDWYSVFLPEEPYVRDKNDKITEIHINVSKPKAETALKPGAWSGKVKGFGIIGVLHVL